MYVSFSYCLTDGLNLQKKGTPKMSKYLLVLVLTTMYTFYLIYLFIYFFLHKCAHIYEGCKHMVT